MAREISLLQGKVIDHWSIMIENGQGNGEEVYNSTATYIRESKAPGIRMEIVKVMPSLFKGAFGIKRNYLLVTNEGLRDFRMYIGARDYGNNLDVCWYLTCEPGLFKQTLSTLLTKGTSEKALSFDLDIFEQQELSAFITVVHHCLLKALEKLMSKLGQDPSKIDRKSKGFLGVS